MAKTQRGFTLVELIVVISIVTLFAVIAMGAFQRYLKEAQIAKLVSHYDDAIRVVRAELVKRAAQLSAGRNDLALLDETFVIDTILDPDGRVTAPLGGPAYLPGDPDPDVGAIGIRITGGNRAGTEVVRIARPAFLEDVTAESVSIYANSAR